MQVDLVRAGVVGLDRVAAEISHASEPGLLEPDKGVGGGCQEGDGEDGGEEELHDCRWELAKRLGGSSVGYILKSSASRLCKLGQQIAEPAGRAGWASRPQLILL